MASDINTKKASNPSTQHSSASLSVSDRWSKAGKSSNSMTKRILQVNIIPLLILAFGILYLDDNKSSIIEAELKTLSAEVRLFADIFAEGAIRPVAQNNTLYELGTEEEQLIPELVTRMVQRVSENIDHRTFVYDTSGHIIADSENLLLNQKNDITIIQLPEQDETDIYLDSLLLGLLNQLTKSSRNIPVLDTRSKDTMLKTLQLDITSALSGQTTFNAWKDSNGDLVITAVAPIQNVKKIDGAVLLIRNGKDIEKTILQSYSTIIQIFLATAAITTLLSLYLAAIIGHPLRRLAIAAERIRYAKDNSITIPDLSENGDEIGELSLALRDMHQTQIDRMDSIEKFAADVAHELKNPLSSLRSAIETAPHVNKEEQRQKLTQIMLHDVQRLDRLITDISRASRLDTELSRESQQVMELIPFLKLITETYATPINRVNEDDDQKPRVTIQTLQHTAPIFIKGNSHKLAQVFENLISNALSFSPPEGKVTLSMTQGSNHIHIHVTDEGPGIPENKCDQIFERFYSERPSTEAFGNHSGLGLSICKQIIKAHHGHISATNITDATGNIIGASFTVTLESISP